MKYVVVDSVKEANRYVRRINKNNTGEMIADVSCCHLIDFAKDIVIQKEALAGNLNALDVLDSTSGAVLLEEILYNNCMEDFFIPVESICHETALEVWNSIQQIRMGKVTAEYQNSTDLRVGQIKLLIEQYEESLIERNQYDVCRIYQVAVSELKDNKNIIISGTDSYCISEICKDKLSALENEFWEFFTGGEYDVCTLFESDNEDTLRNAVFFRSYGMANEVEYVIEQILNQKQVLGDVAVLYTSSEYEPVLEALFGSRRLPYSMLSRKYGNDNRYVGLMQVILRWAESDFSYRLLKPVVMAPGVHCSTVDEEGNKKYISYIDPFYRVLREGIGWGLERYTDFIKRANFERETDKAFVAFLQKLVNVFWVEKGQEISFTEVYRKLVSFVKECIGNHQDYAKVSTAIAEEVKFLEQMGTTEDIQTVVRVLSERLRTMCWDDSEETDAVSIAKLEGNVHILDRKHVYLIGFSAVHMSGSSVDSPVLSDKELMQYLDRTAGFVKLSSEREQRNVQSIYRTLRTRDNNEPIYIGYCGYDTLNLRKLSPAVCYLRMLDMANVQEKDILQAGYSNLISDAVMFSEESIWGEGQEQPVEKELSTVGSDRKWSTTSLQQLLNCPLQFYYQRICGLPVEEYKEPKAEQWLAASEKGTLAHAIMENYCKEWFVKKSANQVPDRLQEASFRQIVDAEVQKMLEKCPSSSGTVYELEQDEIAEKCQNYLRKMHKEFSDPTNPWMVAGCEVPFQDVRLFYTENGPCKEGTEGSVELSFTGVIDRLDSYVDQDKITHFRIMDYKSGGSKRHETEVDGGYQIQHVVYALAMKAEAAKREVEAVIDNVQFLHFFEEDEDQQILTYSGKMIQDFPEKVRKVFVEVLSKEHYCKLERCMCNAANDKKDTMLKKTNCQYCTYKDICREYVGEEL